MKPEKIEAVWKEYGQYLANEITGESPLDFNEKLAGFFCPGDFYFFIFDFGAKAFSFISESYRNIIGLDTKGLSVEQFWSRIHPDDMDYFSKCENTVAKFLFDRLNPEQIPDYKINYCLRLKTIDGSYKLFSHQVSILSVDENGRLGSALGVHANISHLTAKNNKRLSLIGLNNVSSFTNIDVMHGDEPKFNLATPNLTKREKEILKLIADGCTAKEIGGILFIAEPTVRKHRENLLRKTNSSNTAHLVAKCIRNGLI